MDECVQYVVHTETQVGGLFSYQSEHASFQIVTPKANVRLSHGRLHQIATRDPTDQFDLPDHVTWQMNMGIDHHDVSEPWRVTRAFACERGAQLAVRTGKTCNDAIVDSTFVDNSNPVDVMHSSKL